MQFNTVGERVKYASQEAGLTVAQLARRTGLATSTLYDLFTGRSKSTTKLHLVAHATGFNVLWLENETGLERRDPVTNAMARPARDAIDTMPITRWVPIINWVQAGDWQYIADDHVFDDNIERIAAETRVSSQSFALIVRGDSMEPEFPEGARIVVDPGQEPKNGSYVIARLSNDSEATFKQLVFDGDRCYLKPLNSRYPIIEVSGDIVICGVVREQSKRYD